VSAGKDVWGDRAAAGPPQPFFHSRWVSAPECVRELGPHAGLPKGFRAAGVACGIKPSGNPDLGLLVCDADTPVSAARFADTGAPAAPVMLSRERCKLSALRVILANSGCANAATGKRGLDDAAKTQGAAGMAVGVAPEEVAQLVSRARELNLNVRGLMVVAPTDPGQARRAFAATIALADELGLVERSMGMTEDLEMACSLGSSEVRLGRSLFGPRIL